MDLQERLTFKMFVDTIKENPKAVGITTLCTFAGAVLGVITYYNGWLG